MFLLSAQTPNSACILETNTKASATKSTCFMNRQGTQHINEDLEIVFDSLLLAIHDFFLKNTKTLLTEKDSNVIVT